MMSSDNNDTLLSHLQALRKVLIKCLLVLAVGVIPMFFISPYVIDLLIGVIADGTSLELNFFSPMDVFILQLKMAVVLDIIVCFPYIAHELWKFLLPALYDNERKFIKSIVFSSSFLFVFGVLFCLFFILPMVIRFGLSFATDHIKPVLGIAHVVSLSLWLATIFGLMFQFPLITFALLKAEIVSYETLAIKRAYVFVGILAVSGVLTPPDIISQLMLTVPTYGLFELGLWFGKNK